MCCDDAIFVARIVNEVYTGQKGNKQIDLTVKCDNMGVKESLESTHQIEEKLLRPLIEHIKGLLSRKWIKTVDWVRSEECHADVLTKKGAAACAKKILKIFKTGRNFEK